MTKSLVLPVFLGLTAICGMGLAPTHAATLSFISQSNGGISGIGTDIACLSSPPITETLESVYDGFSVRNGTYTPAVGEIWYAHVLISHPGNPCSGGNYNEIDILRRPILHSRSVRTSQCSVRCTAPARI